MTQVRVLIPFKQTDAKSRLARVLSREERQKFATLMLADVIDSLSSLLNSISLKITVVSPAKPDISFLETEARISVKKDPRSLNECVNDELKKGLPLAVIMSDLPLLNWRVLQKFFHTPGDVVIAPGRKGGTNMLLVRKDGFSVSYHYGSFFNHIKIAEKLGFSYTIFDSFYASVDIDDENDLLELLLHGKEKRSREYLTRIGFSVEFRKVPELRRA